MNAKTQLLALRNVSPASYISLDRAGRLALIAELNGCNVSELDNAILSTPALPLIGSDEAIDLMENLNVDQSSITWSERISSILCEMSSYGDIHELDVPTLAFVPVIICDRAVGAGI